MKNARTMRTGALLAATIAASAASYAQERDVEPTEQEIDYMNTLDQSLGETFGGNDTVDATVTESESGQRTIHMDYSESEGMVITAGPEPGPEPAEPADPADSVEPPL